MFTSAKSLLGVAVLVALPVAGRADLMVFSAGMEVPETSSRIPSSFGEFGGDYLVPDARFVGDTVVGTQFPIWRVPAAGGTPSVFANVNFTARGGLFLPEGFGAHGGKFLAVGSEPFHDEDEGGPFVNDRAGMAVIDAAGAVTYLNDFTASLGDLAGALNGYIPRVLTPPLLAPSTFGAFAGQLLVTDQCGGVVAFTAEGAADVVFKSFARS